MVSLTDVEDSSYCETSLDHSQISLQNTSYKNLKPHQQDHQSNVDKHDIEISNDFLKRCKYPCQNSNLLSECDAKKSTWRQFTLSDYESWTCERLLSAKHRY
jgi:hypothetical protein